jgi:hypothetical protein
VEPHADSAPDSGGVGEILFVQNVFTLCGSVMTCATTLPTRSPSGDTLLVTVTYDNPAAQVSALTDDAGNTYALVIPATNWLTQPFRTESWYGISRGAGTKITLTATFSVSTSSFATVYLDEYFGANATSPIDQIAVMTGGGPAADISSGPQTTATARELIFGHGEGVGAAISQGSNFLLRSTELGNIEEDRFVSAIGSYDASFIANGATEWFALMITIR